MTGIYERNPDINVLNKRSVEFFAFVQGDLRQQLLGDVAEDAHKALPAINSGIGRVCSIITGYCH
jgi:hypothetical protein